jgi:hypothetical protein
MNYIYLNTAAGSTLRILCRAKEAPAAAIRDMVINMDNSTKGEKLKISPDLATPTLNPSNNSTPIKKPRIANIIAWLRIRRVI